VFGHRCQSRRTRLSGGQFRARVTAFSGVLAITFRPDGVSEIIRDAVLIKPNRRSADSTHCRVIQDAARYGADERHELRQPLACEARTETIGYEAAFNRRGLEHGRDA